MHRIFTVIVWRVLAVATPPAVLAQETWGDITLPGGAAAARKAAGLGNTGRRSGDSAEAQRSGDQCDNQKDQGVMQHDVSPLWGEW